jgi:hypothetical protein
MNKPGSTLPFEGLYFNHYNGDYVTLYTGVTYDDTSNQFSADSTVECYDFQFLEGCFADLRGNDYYLAFSLLTSVDDL